MTVCKSCGAKIRWAVTVAGKGIPIDLEPVPHGNMVMTGQGVGNRPQVRAVHKDEDVGSVRRYVTHFATCPEAASHRRVPG